MRSFSKFAFLLLLLALPATAQESCRIPDRLTASPCGRVEESRGRPGDFDHYVLSFSWSPAFCDSEAGRRSTSQCRDNDFGWVVHGLWPNYADERAGARWPQYCAPVQPVPAPVLRRHFCSLPDMQLMQCQWAKHGSCTDFVDPATYFAAIERLRGRFRLPVLEDDRMASAALVRAVLDVNPGLERRHFRVVRAQGRLREVRFCLDRALEKPVDC